VDFGPGTSSQWRISAEPQLHSFVYLTAYVHSEAATMNVSGDVAYALRQFRQSPVFAVTAVLTLAPVIGGTTATFSLMHDVMLRSLPVTDPASLYRTGSGNSCCV
jgi:hypothetical protein